MKHENGKRFYKGNNMRKCAFVLPYYGKFGNYFQLFLNSCATNTDYDWLIFTDDHEE